MKSALGALLITVLAVSGAAAAEKAKKDSPQNHLGKRLDLEIGGPAFVALNNAAQPLSNGYWLQFGGAYHFHDDWAVEASGAWGEGEARFSVNTVDVPDESQTVWSGSAGVRWYLLGKRGGPARFYMALGGGYIFNYIDDSEPFDEDNPEDFSFEQKNSGYAYIAPGVRMQAGNRSGLVLRLPFNLTFSDIDASFITPGIAFFFSF